MRKGSPRDIATLVDAAGGELVGRTRLQKTACLLELVGSGLGFRFSYHRYGPYSEELSIAASDADALGYVEEREKHAAWGGRFSVFKIREDGGVHAKLGPAESGLVKAATRADSVELELAVTAAFLADSGSADPWAEVARLKQAKATDERLESAKALYRKFQMFEVPKPLPNI